MSIVLGDSEMYNVWQVMMTDVGVDLKKAMDGRSRT